MPVGSLPWNLLFGGMRSRMVAADSKYLKDYKEKRVLADWTSLSRRGICRTVLFSAVIFLAFSLTAPALWAQVNTSGIRGAVVGSDGAPIAGAEVTLVHTPSGNTSTARTNSSGEFAFTGLRVGGPYQVVALAEGYSPQEIIDIFLSAGKNQRVPVRLQQIEGEEITIEGVAPTPRNTSPRSVFDAQIIDSLPTIGRDPKDIARLTPEVYLDGDASAMSIGGNNNRFNSVTIDGIRQDDDFGLNANGYPSQRSPISIAAIEEIAVETTPFDVRYSRFVGGNVNIVTKSGTNEFHGQVLGAFANESLTGSQSEEDELEIDFREARWGLTVGGPIVKDKVHFFVGLEGLAATTPSSVGAAGSGAANEVGSVSQEDLSEVQRIANDVYGFDAGVPSQSLDEDDLKLIAKIDWAINDKHRLSAKYQRTSGNVVRDGFSNDRILSLTSNWYDQDETLNAFALKVFSNWTDQLSTEAEFSGKLVANRQNPLNGNEFMEAEIGTEDGGTIVLGPDVFRHANRLDNDTFHAKIEANYLLGRHLITGGVEYDVLDVFNLFVPFSRGAVEYDSITDFEAQMPSSIFYQNAISNNPDDGAADWGYGVLGFFLQDQFELNPRVTVQAGVRAEVYQAPTEEINPNENFLARHGFSNTETVNGKFIAQPRLGVTFTPRPRVNLRGGLGLYSGGSPNVWISNSYSNDGVNVDGEFSNDPSVIGGFNGREIPVAMQMALEAGDGNVDAIDPDFNIPSTWKAAAGIDYSFDVPQLGDSGKGFALKVDYVYSRVRDGIKWKDLRRNLSIEGFENNTPVGTLIDGRPFYDNDDSDGSQFNSRRGVDMLLTNTREGYGHTLSLSINKRMPWGMQLYGAYAYTNNKEISPGTSSRSVSNYGQGAVVDPDNPPLATSNYERRHRVIGAWSLSRPLIADFVGASRRAWNVGKPAPKAWTDTNTSFAVFFETRSGQPYSYTFGGNRDDLARLFGEEREFSRRNRMLFYVPRGDGADNVVLDGINRAEFARFLRDTGLDEYEGQIVPRNAFRSPWVTRVDLRFSQEIPNPVQGHRAKLVFDVQNVGNLLNSDWGRVEQAGFPYVVRAVDVDVNPQTGQYIYSNLNTQDPLRVNVLASVWRLQATLVYDF